MKRRVEKDSKVRQRGATSWKKLRVTYDESAHREFITGFSRRKAERRAQAEKKRIENEKAARKDARKQKAKVLRELSERRRELHHFDQDNSESAPDKDVQEYENVSVVVEPMETAGEREWRLMNIGNNRQVQSSEVDGVQTVKKGKDQEIARAREKLELIVKRKKSLKRGPRSRPARMGNRPARTLNGNSKKNKRTGNR